MSSTPIQPEPEESTEPVVTESPAPESLPASAHPDPITGEPGAHPVGVGVGALGAGAAGAAIGSIGGPVGILIGAAIGALAGGLAGKEVAATNDTPPVEESGEPMDDPLSPVSLASIPSGGFRAVSGAGFATQDAGLLSTGTTGTPSGGFNTVTTEMLEDDALPNPTHAAVATEPGFQAPTVPETTPLAATPMPQSGEEAVRTSAYYYYLGRTRTGEEGDALGDWLKAEHEAVLG